MNKISIKDAEISINSKVIVAEYSDGSRFRVTSISFGNVETINSGGGNPKALFAFDNPAEAQNFMTGGQYESVGQ